MIESDFRTTFDHISGHFRYGMARNAIKSEFRTSKMGAGSHFFKKFKKKLRIDLKWPEMPPKVSFGSHFKKKIYKKSWASDLNNVRTDCWPNTTWYIFTFGQYIYRQVCWERGNKHCVHPLGRMHTILVYLVNVIRLRTGSCCNCNQHFSVKYYRGFP